MEQIKVNNRLVNVYDELPSGLIVNRLATTVPRGYVWINNNKSRFGGERKSGLIKEENLCGIQ